MISRRVTQAGIACATLLVLAGVALITAASVPVAFGYTSYIVRSGSMEPAIPVGAVVIGRITPPDALQVGDTITFHPVHGSEAVTHRIVDVESEDGRIRFVTKGDANGARDAGAPDIAEPISRVVYTVPWAGYLLSYLSAPGVRFMIVGAGLLLVILWRSLPVWKGSPPNPES